MNTKRPILKRLRHGLHRLLSLAFAVAGITATVMLLLEQDPLMAVPHGLAAFVGVLAWREFAVRADQEEK
jgi:hypothetical protein